MAEIIIIDIETTGLSPSNAQIAEIAAIKVDTKTSFITDEMTSLVMIDGYVPSFITNLTGIDDQMLTIKGRKITQVLQELSQFCGEAKVYAHNSNFDKRFIRKALMDCQVDFIETEWVDTLKIFKDRLPGMPNYKLETLIKHFKIADKESHRALDDAKHTLEILKIVTGKKAST